ncbi:MAG: RNA-directed DNA polymerase [Bacteroidia bacterium]
MEQVAEMANLELAYYKAKKGKMAKLEVCQFEKNLQYNLRHIQAQIKSGEVEVGGYRYFTIYDPKKRYICAAPFAQRVLHHALMNVCHPFFEKKQIADSFASRIGKGTYAALDRAREYNRKHTWFLKLDARKYFDSLDHGVLRQQLCAMFKDPGLLRMFDRIIDSYHTELGRGVPIGNLTSQYFANHYLSSADHVAKEQLRLPGYVRYMDDMVLWHDDGAVLMKAGLLFQEYVQETLRLQLKPFCLNQHTAGLPFLGYLLYHDTVRLAHRSQKRYIEKSAVYERLLESDLWSQQDFQRHMTPLTAFTEYAQARAFRQKVHEGHRQTKQSES